MRYKDFYYDLFERYAGSKKLRGIWYHGTSTKYLKSILSQGLIPDSKEKSWDVDPSASMSSLDRTTYGGIYLTKDLMTAYSAAWRTAKKTNSNRLIVIVDLQPKSLIADEDDLAHYFSNYHESTALWAYKTIKHGTEHSEEKENLEKLRNDFTENIVNIIKKMKDINNPKIDAALTNLIKNEGFEAVVTRIAAYLDMSSYYNQDSWYRNWNLRKINKKNIPMPPSKSEGENIFRKFIDKLTRTLKFLPRKDDRYIRKTGRSLEPIRFAGSNKIVCIVESIQKPDYSEKLKVHYGQLPQDFVEQYRESKGFIDLVS